MWAFTGIIHIPPNLVVALRGTHNTFAISTRYLHHVPSAPTTADRGMRHGTDHRSDTPKPHHHRRFPGPIHLLPADQRWQGVCRVCPCFPPLPRLSARPQGDLSRRGVSHTPLPLCPCPAGWAHHLACPVHHVSRGVHGPAALRLALPSDATGRVSRCPVGHPWGPQFGAERGDLPYFPHGPLSVGLCVWPARSGDGAHPVWAALAHLLPGRREAQSLSHEEGLPAHACQRPSPLASRLHDGGQRSRPDRVVSGVPTRSVAAGAFVSRPGSPDRWVRQYHQEHA